MTGFGKTNLDLFCKRINIEIRSLNSKQLDLNINIPVGLRKKEMEIRDLLFKTIERGRVDFVIYIEDISKKNHQINKNAVENYFYQIRDIVKNLSIPFKNDYFHTIFSFPGVIESKFLEITDIEWVDIKQMILEALKAFVGFRVKEGEMINFFLNKKIKAIIELLYKIKNYEFERIEKIKEKLSKSIEQIEILSYDKNRFEQELLYYIERLDISEEKARLENHLNLFLETVKNEKSQGKKLGFIVQEIGREINTLGSKSNHIEMQKIVIEMKSELEQIKEQILNVL